MRNPATLDAIGLFYNTGESRQSAANPMSAPT
jgi:hypothetical protein